MKEEITIEKYFNKVFLRDTDEVDKEELEKALETALSQKKNETDEYNKLLVFFWSIQIIFMSICGKLVSEFLGYNLDNVKYYFYNKYVIISIILCISMFMSILSFIQFIYLKLKEKIIYSYMFHIQVLEHCLQRKINTMILPSIEEEYIKNQSISTFILLIINIIWIFTSYITIFILIILKHINGIKITNNIIFLIMMIILHTIIYFVNKLLKNIYKI